MGGKKKQPAQRTKNNVKPSNSGRTTELMTATLGNIKGFGETAFSANLSFDILDPTIDPNFQVVLKKMSKKDVVTRHKALTEFVKLCKESEDEAIKSALPSWIRLYGNLALDIEHRIREAAQHAHHAIVSKVGRNLAPYIKQIAPYWFISQYDTYAPAASAASNSFKAAFPPHKLVDVIVFCQEEILKYISDNILTQSPESISKTEKIKKENMEAKYEQILISSLNGYALYLSKVSKEHLEKVDDINTSIITSPKFWKLTKHKNGAIRAAWFSLLSSVLQFAPYLIENEHKRVANAVFGLIDDYDPVVLPKVWEAVLLIVTSIKDCWQHVNMDKFFLPKFTHILAQGGQGNASFIYPNIILLLSNIPESVMKDKISFFGKIFSSFKEGLKKPCITQSHSESEAVATSFIECIQYLIMIYTDDVEFCNSLIEQYVIDVLCSAMVESLHHHLMTPLFNALGQMLLQWKNNEKSCINYANYSEKFWFNLISNFKNNLNQCLLDKELLSYFFDSNIKFLDFLYNRKCIRRKGLKVKFSENDSELQHNSSLDKNDPVSETEEQLQNDIILAARDFTQEYYNIAANNESYEIKILAIKQLWKITTIFRKDQISRLIEGYENEFCLGLQNWIKDESIITEPLVGVVFSAVDSLKNEKLKNEILLEFTKIRSKDAILQTAVLANSYVNDTMKEWMISSLVKDELCQLFQNLNEEEISVDVLQHCLRSDRVKGFLIGEETVLSLLSILAEKLKSEQSLHNKKLSAILDSFFTDNSPDCLHNYKEILLELIYLCFQDILKCNENWESLFNAWRKGVTVLSGIIQLNDPLLLDHIVLCANFVAKYINDNDNTNEVNLTLTLKLCTQLIASILQEDSNKMVNIGINIVEQFLNSVLNSSVNMYQHTIENICYNTEIMNGNLPWDVDNTQEMNMVILNEKWNPLKDVNCNSYVLSLIFCVKYILNLIEDGLVDDLENEDGSSPGCSIPSFKLTEINNLVKTVLNLCYGLTLTKTLKLHFNDTKQYFMIGDNVNSLGCLLKELIHRLDPVQQTEILTLAEENAEKIGKQWGQTLSIISVDFLDVEKKGQIKLLKEDMVLLNENSPNVEYLHALRCDLLNDSVNGLELNEIMYNIVISMTRNMNAHCRDLSKFESKVLILESELARLLNAFLVNYPTEIDKSTIGWDFIMVNLASWIESISLTKSPKFYKEFVGFVIAVCDLYNNFITYLITQKKDSKLYEEWRDVFLADSCSYIGISWEFIASKTLQNNVNYIGLIHLKKLSETLSKNCRTIEIRALHTTDDNYKNWLERGKKYITSPSIPVQITAYNILITVVPILVKLDIGCDENELHKLTCEQIKTQFIETQHVVTAMLLDFCLDVSCSVTPFTDSYTYNLGYILLWSVLLEMCKQGDSQVRYIYTLWIKEMDLIVHIMESLLKLMPDSVLHFTESNVKKRQDVFTKMPPLSFDGWESERLSNFCCWLFCDILRTLPAVARQWSAETDPKLLSYADRITTTFVSSALCTEEMKAIMNQQKGFDNMKVTTHPSVREVVAVYTVEESSTELVVTLATNHPLTPPKVEIPKAMISSNQTRQWLMQLTIFLTHQNGSIWDGLLLWKNNLDKKFEGIEECYICFSILHNTSHQLPKLSCQTCKKKFHSFCLYKWFTTSNKSTCPICRNHF